MIKVWAVVVDDIGTPANPYYKVFVPNDKHSIKSQKKAIRAYLAHIGCEKNYWKRDDFNRPYIEIQPNKPIPKLWVFENQSPS